MSRSKFENKALTIDGVSQFVFSGEIQQYRLPPSEWRDRLEKAAALGLNCIGVYAGWNFHSPAPGVYDFESPDRDFARFMDEVDRVGVKALVRPGPYVCNEWDLGGFPGWLLKESPDDWRTSETRHVEYSKEWYENINRILAPRQIDHGGPIVIYQLENEHWWGDKDLFAALADAARKDGITVPFISNGGGSAKRCGSDVLVDGCDIYTNVYENWRWRGWIELASRLADDAPLMVVEYNGASFSTWGGPPSGEHILPSEWFMSLTRMFVGIGANLINPFVTVSGITPVNFGSDHCCTAYSEDAAISHWGGLGAKFYMLRLLTMPVSCVNRALAESKPERDYWATDSGYVEGMLRIGEHGNFIVAINTSSNTEQYYLRLPDGRQLPEDGAMSIAPRVSQFHLIDIDCGNGVTIEYSTAQIYKFWRSGSALNVVVYGDEGAAGHIVFVNADERVRLEYTCLSSVNVNRTQIGGAKVTVYAVSTETAERTWFVEQADNSTIPLFGNLDLVRPKISGEPIAAEIKSDTEIKIITDGQLLSLDGPELSTTSRTDGMIEHVGNSFSKGRRAVISIEAPNFAADDQSWINDPTPAGTEWIEVEVCSPGLDVITDPGVYHYVTHFECDGELPECLEFLGISSAEAVISLNGKTIAVYPEKRIPEFHRLENYAVRIPVAGIIRHGANVLAVTLTVIGRHNMGNALFAGISHPVVLYNKRVEMPIPEWEFADFNARKYLSETLTNYPESVLDELGSRTWTAIDFRAPKEPVAGELSDWLDLRAIRQTVSVPEHMQHRPLFLECGKMDDVWCYVNGKMVGRAYHQMSATFDLTKFASGEPLAIVVVCRHYWRPKCLPTIIPRLVATDAALSPFFYRRTGTSGQRAGLACAVTDFGDKTPPAEAAGLWVNYKVFVAIPEEIAAPLFVEMSDMWSSNAVIYWNGQAIGRYSVVGPDRRFYIASGLIKNENRLIIHIDGYGKAATLGDIKVAPFAETSKLSIVFAE
jgi:hypothetical protein